MTAVSVYEALKNRYSCRAYTDESVSIETLNRLFQRAALSPSGTNFQPWKLHVLTEEKKEELTKVVMERTMEGKFHSKRGESFDFRVYPENATEELWERRVACGERMYETIGIAREDKIGRITQVMKNAEFFGAPVGLILTVDPCVAEGQLMDCGIYMQSLMLLAEEEGLGACPQLFWALWANTVREVLGIDDMVVAGFSLGYPDKDAPINTVRQPRLTPEEYVTYY